MGVGLHSISNVHEFRRLPTLTQPSEMFDYFNKVVEYSFMLNNTSIIEGIGEDIFDFDRAFTIYFVYSVVTFRGDFCTMIEDRIMNTLTCKKCIFHNQFILLTYTSVRGVCCLSK